MKKTPTLKNLGGLTWEDVAVLFRAHDLPSSTRQIRRIVAKHRSICPVLVFSYHLKRLDPDNVSRLITKLETERPNRKRSPRKVQL